MPALLDVGTTSEEWIHQQQNIIPGFISEFTHFYLWHCKMFKMIYLKYLKIIT
jgi:hypothetical protein